MFAYVVEHDDDDDAHKTPSITASSPVTEMYADKYSVVADADLPLCFAPSPCRNVVVRQPRLCNSVVLEEEAPLASRRSAATSTASTIQRCRERSPPSAAPPTTGFFITSEVESSTIGVTSLDRHYRQTPEANEPARTTPPPSLLLQTNQISSVLDENKSVLLRSSFGSPSLCPPQQRGPCFRRRACYSVRRWHLPCNNNKFVSSATYFCIVNMFSILFLTSTFDSLSRSSSPSLVAAAVDVISSSSALEQSSATASPFSYPNSTDMNALLQQILPDLIANPISSTQSSRKKPFFRPNTISAITTTATTMTTPSAQVPVSVAPEHDKVHLNVNFFERILKLRLRKVPHPQEHPSFKVLVGDVVNGRPVFTDASDQVTKKNLTHALYQDPENMAAVRISYVPQLNAYQMEGVIGNDLVIHPYDPTKHAHLLADGALSKSRRVILSAPNMTDGETLVDDEALIESPSATSDSLNETTNSTTSGGKKQYWLRPPSSTAASRRALKMQVQNVDENGTPINLPDSNTPHPSPPLDVPNLVYHIITQQHHSHAREPSSSSRRVARPTTDDFAMIQDFAGGAPLTPSSNITLAQRAKRQSDAKIPITWPEILLIVDYETFRMHEGDEERITNYFTTFWNAVDLRYRALPHPDIRLHLTGLIISRDPQFLPFIEENRMPAPEDDAFDSKQALSDMGKHLFYYQTELPDFDMAMLITKLDMCRRKGKHGKCHRGTAGFAYVGGACHVDEKRKKFNKVGIVEDSGGFSGIIVSAHEVGHLLGAVHDGSPAPSYLGGPGATACLWEDGYIMSDLRHDERGFQWSTCTKEQFIHFLSRSQAQCLFNIPRTGVKFSDKLPGKTISLDWQCRLDRGSTACFKDTRVCTQLYCHDKATGYCIAFRPAAEGSACGQGVHCIDGQCVPEQQAIRSRTRKHVASSSDRIHSAAVNSISDGGLIPIPRALRSTSVALREQRSSHGGVCRRDVPGVRISGLPCAEFMQRTSNAFCDHYDVIRYCCSTRRSMCFSGGGAGVASVDALQQRLFLQQQQQFVPPDSPNGDEIFSAFGGSDHVAIARVPANDGGASPSSSSSSSTFDGNQFLMGGTNGGGIDGAPSAVAPTTGAAGAASSGFVNEIY